MKTLIFTVTLLPDELSGSSEFVAVVGNIPELGSWDPINGVKATGPNGGQYTARVHVDDNINEIEFKWIFCIEGTINWEVGLNKIVYDLPRTPGSICKITNVYNGPAQTHHEPELPGSNHDNRCAEKEVKNHNSFGNITRILNPQTWSRRNQILGIGIGLLLPICIAIKIMH